MGLECGDPQNRSGSLLEWQGRDFRHIHPIPRPVTYAPRPWPLPSTPGLAVHPRSAQRDRGCAGGLGPGPGVTKRVLSDRHFLEGSRSLSPALTLIPQPPRWDPGLKSWMTLALTSWVPMVCRRQPPDRLLDGALAASGRRGRFAGTGNRLWRPPGRACWDLWVAAWLRAGQCAVAELDSGMTPAGAQAVRSGAARCLTFPRPAPSTLLRWEPGSGSKHWGTEPASGELPVHRQ